jgi:hypothetical protein
MNMKALLMHSTQEMPIMSDELMRKDDEDDLGLTPDPAAFSYSSPPLSPQRRDPKTGTLHEQPDVNFLEEVPYRPLSWFWTDRIPWNKLTVIEGPPHSAKSLLAIELAARAVGERSCRGMPAQDFTSRTCNWSAATTTCTTRCCRGSGGPAGALQQPGMVPFGLAAKQIERANCLPDSLSIEVPASSAENVKN